MIIKNTHKWQSDKMTLKKNDIVNLTITSATAEGSGVGRTDD